MDCCWGIVTPVKVRHVYAADLLSVELVDHSGDLTSDDIVIRLPVAGNTVFRPADPPLLALHLYDEHANDGRTSETLGPCPNARQFTEHVLRRSAMLIAHVPIPSRRDWLSSLTPGVQCSGDLYTIPASSGNSLRLSPEWKLSRQLLIAGHARPVEEDDAY